MKNLTTKQQEINDSLFRAMLIMSEIAETQKLVSENLEKLSNQLNKK
jgi:type II restriction/modification system DNA methylase subunit YeeA